MIKRIYITKLALLIFCAIPTVTVVAQDDFLSKIAPDQPLVVGGLCGVAGGLINYLARTGRYSEGTAHVLGAAVTLVTIALSMQVDNISGVDPKEATDKLFGAIVGAIIGDVAIPYLFSTKKQHKQQVFTVKAPKRVPQHCPHSLKPPKYETH